MRSTTFKALFFITCALPTLASAQSFDKGTTAVNLGIGLGGYRYSYLTGYSSNYSVSPAMNASIEHGVGYLGDAVIGIGGYLGYKTAKYEYTNNYSNRSYHYDRRWTNTVVGLRGSVHYNEFHSNDQLDLYAGLMLGYNIGSYKDKSTYTYNGVVTDYNENLKNTTSFFTYSTYIGGRYFFTESIGAYLELGWGVTAINLGLTARF